MGQPGPGVHLKATPKVLHQLIPQGLLRRELHDLRAYEGSFEQGSWKQRKSKAVPAALPTPSPSNEDAQEQSRSL